MKLHNPKSEAMAWVEPGGVIHVGIAPHKTPCLAIFAIGTRHYLRKVISVASRVAHDNKTLLVPGIPEAATPEDATDALLDWVDWLAKREIPGKLHFIGAGKPRDGRSTVAERFQRTAAMIEDAQEGAA